jgi:predicted membrane metal-binding protein
MTFEVFLMLLLVVSVFTSLVVEGIKKFVGEKYNASSNLIAGIVAIVLGVIVGVFYCILAQIAFNVQIIIILIALVFLSWLCAMIGYDKVVQAITQIKSR